jgi:hypothetical protein
MTGPGTLEDAEVALSTGIDVASDRAAREDTGEAAAADCAAAEESDCATSSIVRARQGS